jgi:hypothetical protein
MQHNWWYQISGGFNVILVNFTTNITLQVNESKTNVRCTCCSILGQPTTKTSVTACNEAERPVKKGGVIKGVWLSVLTFFYRVGRSETVELPILLKTVEIESGEAPILFYF